MTNNCLSGIIRGSGIARKRSSIGMGFISMLGEISNWMSVQGSCFGAMKRLQKL